MIGAKAGDLPAPTGPSNIDWLQVKNVQGELANTLYRVDTKGGQPPSSVWSHCYLEKTKLTLESSVPLVLPYQ